MARRTLRPWAVWLTLVLLFALWATASYACPRQSAVASPAVAADLPPCHGAVLPSVMDPERPQLCKAHCESGSQSAQAPVNAGPSASYSLWAVLDWRPVTLRPLASRFAEAFAPAVPLPGEPPIYLALRVLRN